MVLRRKLGVTTGVAILLLQGTAAPARGQDQKLLERIWAGAQRAQNAHKSGCGKVTETRTSELLARPLVLRGKFCAEGTDKFHLEYSEPYALRMTFNKDYLNVSTGPGGGSTEVIRIGDQVRRTQGYFSNEESLRNLTGNFDVSVDESGRSYRMKLTPKTRRFAQRIRHIVVELARDSYVLVSLEVDGMSGVNSVFQIEMTELDTEVSEETFEVYRPK